jgi:tetratricopeptide (TPR) repeat protein
MDNQDLLEPIKITNLTQAQVALKRARGSFEEWMECSHIFSINKSWPELEQAAWRAMQDAVHRPIGPLKLQEAAKRFAAASLDVAGSKQGLENSCTNAKSRLEQILNKIDIDNEKLRAPISEQIKTLDEILILLAEGSPQAHVSIASKLRNQLGRADLAIIVATIAIKMDNHEYAAYTTRGAAYSESESFELALKDFSKAEQSEISRRYALAGHTKLLLRQGNYSSALSVGSQLLRYQHTKPMLYLLAAAAKGAGDIEKFDWLISRAEVLLDMEPGTGRILLTRQSIRILIENKQFETAAKVLQELEKIDKLSFINRIKKELHQATLLNA